MPDPCSLSVSMELVQGAQATSADLDPFSPTIDDHGNSLNIRQPTAVGTVFGMAHIMPKLGAFGTDFTLCHLRHLFLAWGLDWCARNWLECARYDTIGGGQVQN